MTTNDPTQGKITGSFDGLTNKPHETYKDVIWVPAWAVQTEYQVLLAVVSILGGALLGAGLSASPPTAQPAAVKAVAAACVAAKDSSDPCASLTLVTSGSGTWQLVSGGVLVLIYIAVLVILEVRKKMRN